MKLTSKQLTKLKTKLALDGSGSKKRLAETLNLHQSQITFLLLLYFETSFFIFYILVYTNI